MGELFIRHEYALAVSQLFLAMLGMGATLRAADFLTTARAPKAFFAGMLCQTLAVPLLALALIAVLPIHPGVAVGIAILAAIPGGTVSNIFTFVARGNVALSIALTAVATLACVFTVPIVLQLLVTDFVPPDFDMPAKRIAAEIVLALLLPLAAGMLLLRLLPRVAAPVARWSVRASLAIVGLIVAGAVLAGRLDWNALGLANIAAIAGFALALVAMSHLVTRACGLVAADRTAINIEITVRNINLGVMVKSSLLPAATAGVLADLALFTLLLYGGLMLLIALPMMLRRRPATLAGVPGSDDARATT
jgi:bile acid:Na+ symporter, BASS family